MPPGGESFIEQEKSAMAGFIAPDENLC